MVFPSIFGMGIPHFLSSIFGMGRPYLLRCGGTKFSRGIPNLLGNLVWGYQISGGTKKSVTPGCPVTLVGRAMLISDSTKSDVGESVKSITVFKFSPLLDQL